mgnify:CR=1 FL=1
MSVREKRLRNEFQSVSEMVAQSGGALAIVSTNGNPPYQYVIEYRCRGVERLNGNDPVYRNTHQVEISLGTNYPNAKPEAKFLTPIFHPNVWPNLDVCLGSKWTMAETLPELIIRIGKIIQYSKDVLNLNSPANDSAKTWAVNNMRRFPVDTNTFKSQIGWEELPVNISFQDL